VVVYDVLGRELGVLVDETLSAGVHSVNFDGSGLPSGVYLYRLETPEGTLTRSMVLLK